MSAHNATVRICFMDGGQAVITFGPGGAHSWHTYPLSVALPTELIVRHDDHGNRTVYPLMNVRSYDIEVTCGPNCAGCRRAAAPQPPDARMLTSAIGLMHLLRRHLGDDVPASAINGAANELISRGVVPAGDS